MMNVMKEKLKQDIQKIKNIIFSSTAGRLIVVGGTIVILFGILGVWRGLDLRAIGFYIAGVFVAPVGLWLAWRRTHALQEQAGADAKKADALIEQAQSHTLQAETDSKRQFSEAFSRAVELLGNGNVAVQQGAIHALAGLARENPEQQWTIFNIITSYIRARSPNPPAEDSPKELTIDIEAAMIEIFNRNIEPEKERLRGYYDLSNAYLKGVDIDKRKTDLKRFIFSGADLSESWLATTNLSGSFFVGTNLSDSSLVHANLSNTDLFLANLSEAKLHGAKLHGAKMSDAINLTQKQIDQAQGDEKTTLPSGITRPDKWIKYPSS